MMDSQRSLSPTVARLLALSIFLLSLPYLSTQKDVYVTLQTPVGAGAWSGSCLASESMCTPSSPCPYDPSVPIALKDSSSIDDACRIFVISVAPTSPAFGGTLDASTLSNPLSLYLSSATAMLFSGITFTTSVPVTVSGWGGELGSTSSRAVLSGDAKGKDTAPFALTFVSTLPSVPAYSQSLLTLRDITVSNTRVTVATSAALPVARITVENSDLAFEALNPAFIFNLNLPSELVVLGPANFTGAYGDLLKLPFASSVPIVRAVLSGPSIRFKVGGFLCSRAAMCIIDAQNADVSFTSMRALVDTVDAHLNISLFNSNIRSATAPLNVSVSTPTNPWDVVARGDANAIENLYMPNVRISGAANFTNCYLSPPSTNFYGGTTRIIYNSQVPSQMTFPAATFEGDAHSTAPGTTLELSSTFTVVRGEAVFGSSDGDCTVIAPKMKFVASASSLSASLTTSCSLIALEGITNTVIPSIRATPSVSKPGILALHTSYPYDANIDLTDFQYLQVHTSDVAPFESSLRRSNGSLEMSGKPKRGIRIVWPTASSSSSSSAMPLPNVTYHVYDASTAQFCPDRAIYMPGDGFVLKIVCEPISPDSSAISVGFQLRAVVGTCKTPPPSDNFYCSNGNWVSFGDVKIGGDFVMPSTNVFVTGNLGINGSIIFPATSFTLAIDGCLTTSSGRSSIIVDVTDLKEGQSKTLITQSESCSSSLLDIPLKIKTPKQGCKKISLKTTSASTRSTLAVIMAFDSSGCNKKWIILGAVLGSLVLLGAITAIVVSLAIRNSKAAKARKMLSG